MQYLLQVNALSAEWIIGIHPHVFTNNGREISMCVIENFKFIAHVSEQVNVNLDNLRAMTALTFLMFKLNTYTLYKAGKTVDNTLKHLN